MIVETPARPTREKLAKIIALANDQRADSNMRRTAKRILARYAKHFPDLVKRKDDSRQDR
jgi:hypothetical protein